MISGLYILHRPDPILPFSRNDLLIYRRYHNELPSISNILEPFCDTISSQRPEERSPFVICKGVNYVSFQGENNLLFIGVTPNNSNVMSIVVFLQNLHELLKLYLSPMKNETQTDKSSILDKDIISDNTHVIHELFDECMDFGVVQTTDYKILKEYIKVEANKSTVIVNELNNYVSSSSSDDEEEGNKKSQEKKKSAKKKLKKKTLQNIKSTRNQAISTQVLDQEMHINSSILRTSSSAISWRPKGIFYPKNEIYIDIIEETVFYYDLQTRTVKFNEIHGRCDVKCFLSGMPTCKIGFNETHLSRVDNDNTNEKTEVEPFLPESETKESQDSNQGNIIQDHDDEDSKEADEIKRHHIPIRNIQFHQCIELGSIYKENKVYFTPPDDKFTLLSYVTEQTKKHPLFTIDPIYEVDNHLKILQIKCTLSTSFKKKLKSQNLAIRLPVDPNIFIINKLEQMRFKSQIGEVSFKIDTSEIFWKIGEISGNTSNIKMMAELSLVNSPLESDINTKLNNKHKHSDFIEDDIDDGTSELDKLYGVNASKNKEQQLKTIVDKDNFKNEIIVTFEVPMLSYSGLKLNYLSVTEEQMKYTSFPWVRYKTESIGSNSEYRFKLGFRNFAFHN